MRILVDMDGVLVDIEKGFVARCREVKPELAKAAPKDRQEFSLLAGFPKKERDELRALIQSEGFFASLPPVTGAAEAMNEMVALGHEVYIVTSAGTTLPYAASEKYRWVDEHLGREFLKNLIITPAKYVVKGDVLIDDRPKLRGEKQAEWEHVLYDWPFNRHIKDKRRLTWENWRDVLGLV